MNHAASIKGLNDESDSEGDSSDFSNWCQQQKARRKNILVNCDEQTSFTTILVDTKEAPRLVLINSALQKKKPANAVTVALRDISLRTFSLALIALPMAVFSSRRRRDKFSRFCCT